MKTSHDTNEPDTLVTAQEAVKLIPGLTVGMIRKWNWAGVLRPRASTPGAYGVNRYSLAAIKRLLKGNDGAYRLPSTQQSERGA